MFGYFQARRARRAAEIAGMIRSVLAERAPKIGEQIQLAEVLNTLNVGRLKVVELEQAGDLKRLEIELAEAERRRDREAKNRTNRENGLAAARERNPKNQKGRLRLAPAAFMHTCEECRAALENRKAAHNNDMFRHATQGHAIAIQAVQNGTEG